MKQTRLVTRVWGNFNDIHKSLKPTVISVPNILHVSCGYDHMGFIDQENNLLLYGRNHKGQCALDSDKLLIEKPTLIPFDRFANYDDYESIDTDFPSQYVKPGLKFSSVYCSKLFTLILSQDRKSLFAVGVNDAGQLGLGVRRDQHFKIFRVPLPKGIIQHVYPGHHNSFVQINDELYAFGGNSFGQLGTGNDFNELLSVKLEYKNIRKISCGLSHTAFLTNEGQVLTVGRGIHGQLGYKKKQTMIPLPVEIQNEIFDDISCGHAHTVAISTTGNVYTWGHGLVEGNVAFGGISAARSYVPKPDEDVPRLQYTIPDYSSGTAMLRSGGYFCMLFHPNIGLHSYGIGMDGQLGTGKRDASDTFVKIDHPDTIEELECGYNWVCSLSKE